MANTATLQEFINGMVDRGVGDIDTNSLTILVGTGLAYALDLGGATGGTFKLSYAGEETGALDYDFDDTEIEAEIEGLDAVGDGEGSVSGESGEFVVQFSGDNRFTRNVLTVSDDSTTGGTGVTVTPIATTDASMLGLVEQMMASLATEFNDDAEEDRVALDVFQDLWEAAAVLQANVR